MLFFPVKIQIYMREILKLTRSNTDYELYIHPLTVNSWAKVINSPSWPETLQVHFYNFGIYVDYN